MANVIKHKRGSGSDPSASDLVVGEVAIRTDTGKLFTKMDNGSVAEIAGGGSDIAINTLSSSSGTGGGSATFNGSAYRFTLSAPPSVSAQQLLVSINGVIQKPVAGTGQPSEGFSVDGNDIILGDAPATGADFFIITFKSLGVSEPADNSVTSAKIVDGAIVNADINASAAIAGSKIDPSFTSAITVSKTGGLLQTLQATDSNQSYLKFINSTTGSGTFTDGLLVGLDNDETAVFWLYENKNMRFATNGTERLTINADGHVDVAGNLDVGAGIDVTGAITGTGDLTIDTNTLHVDSSNNRVGIGTTSPSTGLEIKSGMNSDGLSILKGSNSSVFLGHNGSGDEGLLHLKDGGTTTIQIYGETGQPSFFNAGNVGIGTTSPDGKLDVRGTIFVNGDGTGGRIFASSGNLSLSDGNGRQVLRIDDPGTGNSHAHIFDSNGRLGIGTTSPSANLESQGNVSSTTQFSGFQGLRIQNANGAALGVTADLNFVAGTGSDNRGAVIGVEFTSGFGNDLYFATNPNSVSSNDTPIERFRITSAGNVGISTTSPSALLSLGNGVNAQKVLLYDNDDNNKYGFGIQANQLRQFWPSNSDLTLGTISTNDGSTFFPLVTIDDNGLVGIGTQSPLDKLAINYTVSSSSPAGGIRLQDNTNTTVTVLQTTVSSYNYAGVSGHYSQLYSSRDLALVADGANSGVIDFMTGNTKRITVRNDGHTCFGTSDNIIFNHSSGDDTGVVLSGSGGLQVATLNDQCTIFNRMGTDGVVMSFHNDGTCVGYINVSGSTTGYSTNCSDRTLKKNFEDWTENALSLFKDLKPQKFNFTFEDDSREKTKGYVAQDLVNSFPEAYPKNDEGKYVFNPSGMVVYLMKALQEAVARIEALETG